MKTIPSNIEQVIEEFTIEIKKLLRNHLKQMQEAILMKILISIL